MPTYEYICEKCGHQFDLFQRISASALKTCPQDQCSQTPWGKGQLKRLIGTGSGIIFKGSGFYETDYRSDKYKASAQKDSIAVSTTPLPHKTETAAKTKSATESKTVTAAKAKD
jgi:putative FmdB family regulatory protein